ncbi:MAG: helix-turn-helix domain-containing protein [Hyphomicrobiaceae bacterium]
MAGEQMPVTPALVTWARERAGFSIEQAATRFKKIAAWEAGEGGPTYPQLEDLADAFKVPVAVFFFPKPPKVPSITESFRTIPAAQLDKIAPRIRLLLRKAKAFQLSLAELNGGRNPAERQIIHDLRARLDMPAGDLAERVRDYLGVSIEEQRGWPSADVALESWRSAFAKVGVYVFKDAFKAISYAGFCLYDQQFPIIYVNNSAAKERQIFTLFHELGHLIFHTSGIDFRSDDLTPHLVGEARRIEILCNRFAGAFLVPDDALGEAMRGQVANETTARALARDFNVSWLVVYRRFLDLRLIDRNTYAAAQAAADAAQDVEREEGSGGNYYNTTMAYLGREFLGMAMREYYQNRITEAQLAEHLGVSLKNLSGIEDRFLKAQSAHV